MGNYPGTLILWEALAGAAEFSAALGGQGTQVWQMRETGGGEVLRSYRQ